MGAAPKVLFICAQGRSGSTLLGNLLGELEGWVSVGEFRRLPESLRIGRRCGCGALVSECEFWARVRERAAGESPLEEGEAFQVQERHVRTRPRALLRMFRAAPTVPSSDSPAAAYARHVAALHRAVAAETGARVVVDSSKGPHDAYVLRKFTGLDLRMIHLVRDPRAVAHSWLRVRSAPDNPRMRRAKPLRASVGPWIVRNAFAELAFRRALGPRYRLLRYEDFAADPAAAITAACAVAGEPPASLSWLPGHAVELGVHHTVGGNPVRERRGILRVEPDREWELGMKAWRRAAVTLATVPMLRRYGYPLRGR